MSGLHAGLCVVFGFSAWSKLGSYTAFVASLRPMRLGPDRLVRPAAAAITATELAVAVGLGWAILAGFGVVPVGAVPVASLALAGLLLTVLTAGIALALHRGSEATCACFGATGRPLRRRHLVRNGLLIGVVLAGLMMQTLAGHGTAPVGGAVVAVTGGAIVALILIRLDELVELFEPIRSTEPASRIRS